MSGDAAGTRTGPAVRLCLFARPARFGQVKSRLAAGLGEEQALDAYRRLLRDTLQRLARVPGIPAELWLAGTPDPWVLSQAAEFGLRWRRQRGADLGARMALALDDCLAGGAAGLIVGSDCPPIDAEYVRAAAAVLTDHDLVLGPAEDGGYGLIGLSRGCAALFEGVPWGTSQVLVRTLEIAGRAGLTVALLDTVWDVDTPADWQRYLDGSAR